jgi:hypothetical protein
MLFERNVEATTKNVDEGPAERKKEGRKGEGSEGVLVMKTGWDACGWPLYFRVGELRGLNSQPIPSRIRDLGRLRRIERALLMQGGDFFRMRRALTLQR